MDLNLKILREAALELAGRNLRAENDGERRTRITLDVDSLPIKVHGHQPQAEWNGHYRARIYHPLITSIAETGDMLDARLRPGNVGTAPSRQICSANRLPGNGRRRLRRGLGTGRPFRRRRSGHSGAPSRQRLASSTTTSELCRKHGLSPATFCKLKAKYGGMDLSDAKRLEELLNRAGFAGGSNS